MPCSTPWLDRLEGDAGGVAALGAADDLDADALAPRGELVDGGGAERVGRAEGDGVVLGDEDPGDLADGGGLAGAVDADDEHDAGLAVLAGHLQAAVHVGADELDELLAQHGAGVGGLAALDAQAGAQPLDQGLGGCDADVGGEQGVLDGLPRVLVEAVTAEQREQALAEASLRAREALAQADEPGGGALRLSRGPGRWRRRRPAPVEPPSAVSVSPGGGAMTSVPAAGGADRLRRPAVSSPASVSTPTTAMPMIR